MARIGKVSMWKKMDIWKDKLKKCKWFSILNSYRIKYREKKKAVLYKKYHLKKIQNCGNKYSTRIICLIHRENEKTGLFSDMITFLGDIKAVVDNGWYPVIDMQNFSNMYLKKEQLGKENAWEFFFEQPTGISVEESFGSQQVIGVVAGKAPDYPFASVAFLQNEYGKLTMWRYYVKKYVRVKKDLQEKIDEIYHGMVKEGDKVCGVLVRGSDYTTMKPQGHPIQPTIEQIIEKVTEVVAAKKCNKIYLSTEEQKIVDKMKSVFGDTLMYVQKAYIDYQGGYLADVNVIDKRQNGIDYLTQIAILAKCDCIVAGVCSGTVGAALLSEGFEYEYYWDLGYY